MNAISYGHRPFVSCPFPYTPFISPVPVPCPLHIRVHGFDCGVMQLGTVSCDCVAYALCCSRMPCWRSGTAPDCTFRNFDGACKLKVGKFYKCGYTTRGLSQHGSLVYTTYALVRGHLHFYRGCLTSTGASSGMHTCWCCWLNQLWWESWCDWRTCCRGRAKLCQTS